jgi:peptide/nickel transport system substrate-binding protein
MATAALLVVLVAACSPATPSVNPSSAATSAPVGSVAVPSSAPSSAPSSSVDTTNLVIAVGGLGSQVWDPAISDSGVSAIKDAVQETLLRRNTQTRALEPGLAESWTESADGLTLDIKLRPNIPFQDGMGDVTADDVKFTYQQYMGPTSDQGNQEQTLVQAIGGDINNIEIVGPLELKIHSPKFTEALLTALANGSAANAMYIQSKKYWTEQAATAMLHPIGTGPYKFVSSTPGVDVKLQAVDTHWRQTATFKNVTLTIIPDDAARLAAVQSGAADIAVIPAKLVGEATAAGTKVVSASNYADMSVILGGQYPGDPANDPTAPWIQASAPDKGLLIRQALSLSIDRATILSNVLAGQGTLTTGPALQYPNVPDRNDPSWTLPVYDPVKAKDLLSQGGFPNGFPITFQEFENRPGSGQADVGEAVAGYFEAIGLTVKRQTITDDQSDGYVGQPPKTQGLAFIRFDPFYDESIQSLQCCYVPGAGHQIQYDPVFTDALKNLINEPDADKRAATTRAVIQHLIDTAGILPLFTANWTVAVSPKVGSWDILQGEGSITNVSSIKP